MILSKVLTPVRVGYPKPSKFVLSALLIWEEKLPVCFFVPFMQAVAAHRLHGHIGSKNGDFSPLLIMRGLNYHQIALSTHMKQQTIFMILQSITFLCQQQKNLMIY